MIGKQVVYGLLKTVTALLEAGSDIKMKANDGSNVLIALATNHHENPDFLTILRFLIVYGADINAVTIKKQNLLTVLCYHYNGDNFFKILKLLVKCGIDINFRDSLGHAAYNILIQKRGFSKDSAIVYLLCNPSKFNV